MVQNQVTVSARTMDRCYEGPSAKPGHWRKAKKRGRQREFDNTTPLRQPRQLAEGVEFSERNADFSPLWPSFGGRGSNLREKHRSLDTSPPFGEGVAWLDCYPIGGRFEPRRALARFQAANPFSVGGY